MEPLPGKRHLAVCADRPWLAWFKSGPSFPRLGSFFVPDSRRTSRKPELLDRASRNLLGVFQPGLAKLKDLLGDEFGQGIVAVFYGQSAQCSLVSICKTPYLLGPQRDVLQQSVATLRLHALWRFQNDSAMAGFVSVTLRVGCSGLSREESYQIVWRILETNRRRERRFTRGQNRDDRAPVQQAGD
jgi:hypothetical protein